MEQRNQNDLRKISRKMMKKVKDDTKRPKAYVQSVSISFHFSNSKGKIFS